MRTTPRALAPIVGTLLLAGLAGLLAGWATAQPTSGRAPAATSSPTASTPDPVEACVRQVTYWVGETLRAAPDEGFDYQHMGLSGATYDVVRALTAEARAASSDVDALVARRALEECRVLRGSGAATPSDGSGGWP